MLPVNRKLPHAHELNHNARACNQSIDGPLADRLDERVKETVATLSLREIVPLVSTKFPLPRSPYSDVLLKTLKTTCEPRTPVLTSSQNQADLASLRQTTKLKVLQVPHCMGHDICHRLTCEKVNCMSWSDTLLRSVNVIRPIHRDSSNLLA